MAQLNEHATTILMGSLREMLDNRKYTYISSSSPKFSHLEDAGKEFVINLIDALLPLLVETKTAQAKFDAEELMLKKLST